MKKIIFIDDKAVSLNKLGESLIEGIEKDFYAYFGGVEDIVIVNEMIYTFGEIACSLKDLDESIKQEKFEWDELVQICREILTIDDLIGNTIIVKNIDIAEEIIQIDENIPIH